MPIYEITAPDGRQFELEGDSPPTEQEMEEVYAGMPQQKAPAGVAEASMAPAGEDAGGDSLVEPGVLSALGVGAWGAGKAAPAIIAKTGKILEEARAVPRAIGGGAGMLAGGSMGHAIAGGPGAAMGGMLGYRQGTKVANKAIPSIQKMGETLKLGAEKLKAPAILDKKGNVLFPAGSPHSPTFPVKGANYKSVTRIAEGLGKLGKIAGPIGTGLTMLDLAQMLLSGEMGKNVARLAKGFREGDPRAAMGQLPNDDVDDAKIQELMAHMRPSASH